MSDDPFAGFPDDMTLGDARDKLRELVWDGHRCPCCTQYAQVYKRTINAGIARALIVMHRAEPGGDWMHKPTVLSGLGAAARDESIARYWGLLEEETTLRADGGRAGWWRVTPKGRQFVLGLISVPKYAHIYDGRALKLDGKPVDIAECLGKKFDYRELMHGI
jgi:hypothetical protein